MLRTKVYALWRQSATLVARVCPNLYNPSCAALSMAYVECSTRCNWRTIERFLERRIKYTLVAR